MHPLALPENRSGANGMKCGDRVVYEIDGRAGVANEFLPDGDAFVAFDDGSHDVVKWSKLKAAPPGEKVNCGICGHFFDSSDKRCHIHCPPDPRYPPRCPACTIQTLQGTEVWAVWNDCQGFWTDGVTDTRAAARELLKPGGRYDDLECRVVPCRLYPEHPDNVDLREWVEANREAGEAR